MIRNNNNFKGQDGVGKEKGGQLARTKNFNITGYR